MGDTLTWDLVARDKSIEATMSRLARSVDGLANHMEGAAQRSGRGFTKLAKDADDTGKKLDSAFDGAAKKIAADLDRIQREAWDSGRDMDREFVKSLKSVQSELDRVRADAAQTGHGLDSDLGAALRNVKRDMERLGDQARETGREIEQSIGQAGDEAGDSFGDSLGEQLGGGLDFGGMLEGALGKAGVGAGVAAGAAVVGGFIADQIIQGFQHSMQQLNIGGKLAAASGKDLGFAMRAGQVVGDAWEDGFGDSMEDVAETANQALAKGLADTPEQLEEVTRKIETIGEVTGRSAEEIASGARAMVKSGLVDSLDEAFDVMVAGAQRGADAGGDMLDVLSQNSVTLTQFGIDARTALGIFKQSLDAGAPSADAFVGSLEELSGNAYDAIPVFEELGLGGIEFANALAGGGPKAKSALDDLLDSIRSIKDPAERSRVMVQLFGEEATAMGDAILAVDLDKAADGFDDINGSAEKAAASISAFKNPLESLQRDTTGMISDPFEHLWDVLSDPAPAENVDNTAAAANKAEEGLSAAATAGYGYASSLQEIVAAGQEWANGVLDLSSAQIGFQDSLAQAAASLKENGENLDITTEKGRNNQKALDDIANSTWKVIEGMQAQNATTEEVRGFMEGARGAFVQMAIDMGMDAAAANGLADKLGLIPGNYVANIQVTGHELAIARAEEVERRLAQLPSSKIINLRINASGSGMGGHMLPGLAEGGPVVAGEPYVVGEDGPELFVPRQSGQIIPNDEMVSSEMFRSAAAGLRPGSGAAETAVMSAAPVQAVSPIGRDDDRIVRLFTQALERVTVTLDGRMVGILQGRQAGLLGRTG